MFRVLSVYVYIIGCLVFVTPFTQGKNHPQNDKQIGEKVTEWFKTNIPSSLKDFVKTIDVRGPCRSVDFIHRESSDGCQFPDKICLGICLSYTIPLLTGKQLTYISSCKPAMKNMTVPVWCPRRNIVGAVKWVTESCSCEGSDFTYDI